MTQEQKQLLLKDLCGRLPYNVLVKWRGNDVVLTPVMLKPYVNEGCMPYLRPISSMTEEEDKEWQIYKNNIAKSCDERLEERISELHDWFNRQHFDFHGLIPKGLAIEALEGMYKTE